MERLEQREMLSTFFVSLSGDDTNTGTAADPFRTIQKAIDETAAGDAVADTINVEAGTYDSPKDLQISIPSSANINDLQVVGGWDAGSVFTTRTPRSTVYVPQQPGNVNFADVDVFADNVTIDGFHFVFDGTVGAGGARQSGGIFSRGNTFKLNDNLIEVGSSSAAGVFDAYGFQTIFGNLNNGTLTLTHNEFQADALHASGAIYLNPGSATSVIIGGAGAFGNTVSGSNLSQGIVADGMSNVTIQGNTITRTGPIADIGFQQLIFAGPFSGTADQTNVTISDNILEGGLSNGVTNDVGIEVGNTSGSVFTISAQVTGNSVQDNRVGILMTRNTNSLAIDQNTMVANLAGLAIASGVTVAPTITNNSFVNNINFQLRDIPEILGGATVYAIFSGGNGNKFNKATVVTNGAGVVQSTASLNIRSTIQQSIDDASAGQFVEVAEDQVNMLPAVYSEQLIVNKNGLTLLGRTGNKDDVQVVAPGPGNVNAADVDVFADNVTIDGFHFVFDGTVGPGGVRPSAGILSRGNTFTLNNNRIEIGSSSAAGAFDAYGLQTIFGNLNNGTITVTRNEFEADAQNASGAIYLNPGAATAINIGGTGTAGNTVSGGNLSQGIVADGISNVTIQGNHLSRTGPVAGAGFQQLIFAGPFNGSANQTGILIDSNVLDSGDVPDSVGIEVGNTSGNGFDLVGVLVSNNTVQNCTVGILVTDNASNPTIQGGQLDSNAVGVLATSSDSVNAPVTNLTLTNVQATNNTSDGARGLNLSGVVSVTGGTYNGNGDDGLDIDGDNAAGTRLVVTGSVDASNNGDDGLFATQFPTGGATPHVSITGGTFDNNGTTTASGDGIQLVAVGDVAFIGVTATGNDPGVLINGAASYTDTDGVFSNNDDHGIQLIDIAGDVTLTRTTADNNDADADLIGDGLNATASVNPQAIGGNLTISGGTFRDTDAAGAAVSQRNGIFVSSVAGTVTLQNSGIIAMTVTGNRADGLNITGIGTNAASLTNGSYSDNGDDGIDLDNFATVTLDTVTANGNGDHGFEVSNVSGTLFLSDLTLGPAPSPNGSGFGGDISSVGTVDFTTTTTPAGVADTVTITSTQFQHDRAGTLHQPVSYTLVTNLIVRTLDGSDTLDVQSTNPGTTTTVNAGDNSDTINVGNAGTLDGIAGPLTINGEANDAATTTTLTVTCGPVTVTNTLPSGDVLNLNDQADADPSTYTLTATTFQRTGTALMTYGTVESVTLNAGTGADTINVNTTAASVNTTINTTGGGDAVNVATTGSTSNVIINGDGSANAIAITTTGNGSVIQVNAAGGADVITFAGSGNNSGVELNGDADADAISVQATVTGTATVVNGGANNDTINLGSVGNSLDGILGAVCVNGDGNDAAPTTTLTVTCGATTATNTLAAGDVLNLNDHGDADPSTYTLTATTFQRTGIALVTYGSLETLTVNAGTAADTINVTDTAPSANTTVNTTSGGDSINVTTTGSTSNLVINADGSVNAIAITTTGTGSVTQVNAAGGADTITLSANGSNSGVELNGEAGSDAIDIQATAVGSATVVNGGANNDTVNLGSVTNSLDAILGVVCVNGDANDPAPTTTLTCGVASNTLESGDTLNFNDGGDISNNSYTLTATTLNRAGMAQVTYGTAETVNLNAGTGNDTINVTDTAASANTTINANDGADTITLAANGASSSVVLNGQAGADTIAVQNTSAASLTVVNAGDDNDAMTIGNASPSLDGILGSLCANGDAGLDMLTVNDTEDATGDVGTLTPTSISGISVGVINYDTVESLEVNLGRGSDNFTISNTLVGTTRVNAGQALVPNGALDDVVNINNSSGTTLVDGQNGNDSITGGPGNDVLIGGPGSPPPNGIQGDTDQDGVLDAGEIWTDRDTLTCGTGADVIFFTPVEDTINPDCGDAQQFSEGKSPKLVTPGVPFVGDATSEVIIGTAGDDTIDGAGGNDFVIANEGADIVNGGEGDDTVRGGEGNDQIDGGTGSDGLFGGPGNDTINGDGGNDFLEGGLGDDTIDGGNNDDVVSDLFGGNDRLVGGDDNDTLLAGPGNDTVRGGNGNDVLLDAGLIKVSIIVSASDPEFLEFSPGGGNDDMDGDNGDDTVNGGPGDDLLKGSDGNDIIVDVFMDFVVTEDTNHNGLLDAGEDLNGNGQLDLSFSEDINGNNQLDLVISEDLNGNGHLDTGEDINGNGRIDFLSEDFNASSFSNVPNGNVPDLSRFGAFPCSTALPAFVLGCVRADLGGNDTLDGGAGDDTVGGGTGRDQVFGGPGADFLMGSLLADEHALASSERFDSFDRDDTLDAGAGDGSRDILVDVSDSRKRLNDGRQNKFQHVEATDIVISRFTRKTLVQFTKLRTSLFGNSVLEACTVKPGQGQLTSPVCDPIVVKRPGKVAVKEQIERFTSGFGQAMQSIIGINPLGKSKGRAIGPQPAPVPVSFQVPDASTLDSLLESILQGK